jgi:hypothetical protein
MMRKNALFIVLICVLSSFFSVAAFGEKVEKAEKAAADKAHAKDLLQHQIVLTEALIQQLELEKSTYDAKAQAIGREADRIQFQFYTKARALYKQQEYYRAKSRALEQEIGKLRQKKEELQRQIRE